MLTNLDIKKLKEIFLTKEDMQRFVTKDEYHRTTIDILDLIKAFRQELKSDIQDLKNDIVTFKDEILHEIVKLREDVAVVVGYRDMIENHEQRIGKLENVVLH